MGVSTRDWSVVILVAMSVPGHAQRSGMSPAEAQRRCRARVFCAIVMPVLAGSGAWMLVTHETPSTVAKEQSAGAPVSTSQLVEMLEHLARLLSITIIAATFICRPSSSHVDLDFLNQISAFPPPCGQPAWEMQMNNVPGEVVVVNSSASFRRAKPMLLPTRGTSRELPAEPWETSAWACDGKQSKSHCRRRMAVDGLFFIVPTWGWKESRVST